MAKPLHRYWLHIALWVLYGAFALAAILMMYVPMFQLTCISWPRGQIIGNGLKIEPKNPVIFPGKIISFTVSINDKGLGRNKSTSIISLKIITDIETFKKTKNFSYSREYKSQLYPWTVNADFDISEENEFPIVIKKDSMVDVYFEATGAILESVDTKVEHFKNKVTTYYSEHGISAIPSTAILRTRLVKKSEENILNGNRESLRPTIIVLTLFIFLISIFHEKLDIQRLVYIMAESLVEKRGDHQNSLKIPAEIVVYVYNIAFLVRIFFLFLHISLFYYLETFETSGTFFLLHEVIIFVISCVISNLTSTLIWALDSD